MNENQITQMTPQVWHISLRLAQVIDWLKHWHDGTYLSSQPNQRKKVPPSTDNLSSLI